jgi:uncharacterized membrane protein (UPF0127 family)
MYRVLFFAWLLAGAGLTGCNKPEVAAPAPPPPQEHKLPTHAQSKLQTMKIYLGPETLDAELALTPIEEETGMMFRTNILDTDAMLFVLPYTQQASFWMMHCPESISCAYIDPDGVIQEIHHLEKNDTNVVLSAYPNIRFVLETSEGWFARHHIGTNMVITTEHGSLPAVFLRN